MDQIESLLSRYFAPGIQVHEVLGILNELEELKDKDANSYYSNMFSLLLKHKYNDLGLVICKQVKIGYRYLDFNKVLALFNEEMLGVYVQRYMVEIIVLWLRDNVSLYGLIRLDLSKQRYVELARSINERNVSTSPKQWKMYCVNEVLNQNNHYEILLNLFKSESGMSDEYLNKIIWRICNVKAVSNDKIRMLLLLITKCSDITKTNFGFLINHTRTQWDAEYGKILILTLLIKKFPAHTPPVKMLLDQVVAPLILKSKSEIDYMDDPNEYLLTNFINVNRSLKDVVQLYIENKTPKIYKIEIAKLLFESLVKHIPLPQLEHYIKTSLTGDKYLQIKLWKWIIEITDKKCSHQCYNLINNLLLHDKVEDILVTMACVEYITSFIMLYGDKHLDVTCYVNLVSTELESNWEVMRLYMVHFWENILNSPVITKETIDVYIPNKSVDVVLGRMVDSIAKIKTRHSVNIMAYSVYKNLKRFLKIIDNPHFFLLRLVDITKKSRLEDELHYIFESIALLIYTFFKIDIQKRCLSSFVLTLANDLIENVYANKETGTIKRNYVLEILRFVTVTNGFSFSKNGALVPYNANLVIPIFWLKYAHKILKKRFNFKECGGFKLDKAIENDVYIKKTLMYQTNSGFFLGNYFNKIKDIYMEQIKKKQKTKLILTKIIKTTNTNLFQHILNVVNNCSDKDVRGCLLDFMAWLKFKYVMRTLVFHPKIINTPNKYIAQKIKDLNIYIQSDHNSCKTKLYKDKTGVWCRKIEDRFLDKLKDYMLKDESLKKIYNAILVPVITSLNLIDTNRQSILSVINNYLNHISTAPPNININNITHKDVLDGRVNNDFTTWLRQNNYVEDFKNFQSSNNGMSLNIPNKKILLFSSAISEIINENDENDEKFIKILYELTSKLTSVGTSDSDLMILKTLSTFYMYSDKLFLFDKQNLIVAHIRKLKPTNELMKFFTYFSGVYGINMFTKVFGYSPTFLYDNRNLIKNTKDRKKLNILLNISEKIDIGVDEIISSDSLQFLNEARII